MPAGTLAPGETERKRIPSGMAMGIRQIAVSFLLNIQKGVDVMGDPDYRGEVAAIPQNSSDQRIRQDRSSRV